MKTSKIAKLFRVDKPEHFKLAKIDPAETLGFDKDGARAMIADNAQRIADLQQKLYAQHRWAVLMILQGMDAAGKDSIIEHVMAQIDPQGCEIHAFKTPSVEELDHDFLWRAGKRLPERGRIGIFNRSHYEECLIVRVHPEFLQKQKLPAKVVTKNLWKERFEDIRGFERHLVRSGTLVLKFHLRISKEEQRRRFLDRLDDPSKRWKFSMGDVAERKLWLKYMAAYQDMIRNTSPSEAPWYVVPADHKWFARLVVSAVVLESLQGLDLKFPAVEDASSAEVKKVRAALSAEKPGGK